MKLDNRVSVASFIAEDDAEKAWLEGQSGKRMRNTRRVHVDHRMADYLVDEGERVGFRFSRG